MSAVFKMDRTITVKLSHKDLEKNKHFSPEISYGQRLAESWYLTCMAYGIDYKNPPKMEKTFCVARKNN
jgi:hypothetical protein